MPGARALLDTHETKGDLDEASCGTLLHDAQDECAYSKLSVSGDAKMQHGCFQTDPKIQHVCFRTYRKQPEYKETVLRDGTWRGFRV